MRKIERCWEVRRANSMLQRLALHRELEKYQDATKEATREATAATSRRRPLSRMATTTATPKSTGRTRRPWPQPPTPWLSRQS